MKKTYDDVLRQKRIQVITGWLCTFEKEKLEKRGQAPDPSEFLQVPMKWVSAGGRAGEAGAGGREVDRDRA